MKSGHLEQTRSWTKARSALKKEKTTEQTKGSKKSEIWSQSLVLTKREGNPKGKTMTKSFVYCFEMQFSFGEIGRAHV